MVRKVMTWGFLAFLLFFIAFRPDAAGDVLKWIGGGIADVAQGLGHLFTDLVSG